MAQLCEMSKKELNLIRNLGEKGLVIIREECCRLKAAQTIADDLTMSMSISAEKYFLSIRPDAGPERKMYSQLASAVGRHGNSHITMAQLCEMSKKELNLIRNLGEKGLAIIREECRRLKAAQIIADICDDLGGKQNEKPISDLRNSQDYKEAFKSVDVGAPVFFTENGRCRYVLADNTEYETLKQRAELAEDSKQGRLSIEDAYKALGV